MRLPIRLLAAAAMLSPIMAHAETVRLTPEQAEEAIAKGAARRQASTELLSDLPSTDRRIHGEVGVAVGTGGYRSIYGVAAVPLGDNGGVVLGYNQTRGRTYGRYPGNLCRGVSDEQCAWRLSAQDFDAQH